MLFLFSVVGEHDAPTRIRVGSHADIARQLAPAAEQGLTLGELAADGFATSAHRAVVTATGDAGTVYLCHPFLVHAAQPHQGERPRFLAQQPLLRARIRTIGRTAISIPWSRRPHGLSGECSELQVLVVARRPALQKFASRRLRKVSPPRQDTCCQARSVQWSRTSAV